MRNCFHTSRAPACRINMQSWRESILLLNQAGHSWRQSCLSTQIELAPLAHRAPSVINFLWCRPARTGAAAQPAAATCTVQERNISAAAAAAFALQEFDLIWQGRGEAIAMATVRVKLVSCSSPPRTSLFAYWVHPKKRKVAHAVFVCVQATYSEKTLSHFPSLDSPHAFPSSPTFPLFS